MRALQQLGPCQYPAGSPLPVRVLPRSKGCLFLVFVSCFMALLDAPFTPYCSDLRRQGLFIPTSPYRLYTSD